jgi:hypothetical protein
LTIDTGNQWWIFTSPFGIVVPAGMTSCAFGQCGQFPIKITVADEPTDDLRKDDPKSTEYLITLEIVSADTEEVPTPGAATIDGVAPETSVTVVESTADDEPIERVYLTNEEGNQVDVTDMTEDERAEEQARIDAAIAQEEEAVAQIVDEVPADLIAAITNDSTGDSQTAVTDLLAQLDSQ